MTAGTVCIEAPCKHYKHNCLYNAIHVHVLVLFVLNACFFALCLLLSVGKSVCVYLTAARLAFCGRTGHLAFEFPFTEFLPKEQRVTFTAHVSITCSARILIYYIIYSVFIYLRFYFKRVKISYFVNIFLHLVRHETVSSSCHPIVRIGGV